MQHIVGVSDDYVHNSLFQIIIGLGFFLYGSIYNTNDMYKQKIKHCPTSVEFHSLAPNTKNEFV